MPFKRGTRYPLMGAPSSYADRVLALSPIAYWPLWEASGTVAHCLVNPAQNGTYTGVTLADTTTPWGDNAPLFDGVNDKVDIFSAALAAAFDGTSGSITAWFKVAELANWTDGSQNFIFNTEDAPAAEYLRIYKNNNNNRFSYRYTAGGGGEGHDKNSITTIAWTNVGMTWSDANDQVCYFWNGEPEGTIDTGLNTWVTTITKALIGAQTGVPGNPMARLACPHRRIRQPDTRNSNGKLCRPDRIRPWRTGTVT